MNELNKTIGIVIQGPTTYYEKIIDCFKLYGENVVFSTWKSEPQSNIRTISNHIKVCLQDLPDEKGYGNINCQTLSSVIGLLELKSCDYVLKIRSDMIPTNIDSLLKSFVQDDKLTFMCWHKDGYLVDYFNFGKRELMFKFWDLFSRESCPAEFSLLKNFSDKFNISYPTSFGDVKPHVNFCLNDLTEGNDIFWIKNNTFLSSYKNHPECYFY